jgi:hypothetical protein
MIKANSAESLAGRAAVTSGVGGRRERAAGDFSGAAFGAIKFNVKAVGVAVAASLAEVSEPSGASTHFFQGGRLGHKENFVAGNFAAESGEHMFEFVDVFGAGDDKFKLKRVVVDPSADDLGLPASGLVFFPPGGLSEWVGCGVEQLGGERGEVAGDPVGGDGGSGFDGDMTVGGADFRGEEANIGSPPVRTVWRVERWASMAATIWGMV